MENGESSPDKRGVKGRGLRSAPKSEKVRNSLIIAASTRELLFQGFIGHHAELSPARECRSGGCLAQAWSAAMLVELLGVIRKDGYIRLS